MKIKKLRWFAAVMVFAVFITVSFSACGRRPIYDDPSKTPSTAHNTPENTGTAVDTSLQPSETSQADNTQEPEATDPAASAVPTETESTAPTESHPSITENASATPAPTPDPTNQSSEPSTSEAAATPSPAPVTGLTWIYGTRTLFCDMDHDGSDERIDFSVNGGNGGVKCRLDITLGGTCIVLSDEFTVDRFLKGLLNDFNPGDGRTELLISVCRGTRDFEMISYRFDENSSALTRNVFSGWIETAHGNIIEVGRYYDIMGTWACTAEHTFSNKGSKLEQVSDLWLVKPEEGRWCTVADDLIVGLYTSGPNNESAYLTRGDILFPVSTDLSSIINIELESGAQGYMVVSFDSDGRPSLGGSSIDELFTDLTYIN